MILTTSMRREQLGLALSQNNDQEAAANVIRDLVRREPAFGEGHNNLGLVLLQSGHIHGAEAQFAEAVRLKPRYAEAHYNLALAFRQQGKAAGVRTLISDRAGIEEYSAALR